MDGRPNRRNEAAFSNFSGIEWMRPYSFFCEFFKPWLNGAPSSETLGLLVGQCDIFGRKFISRAGETLDTCQTSSRSSSSRSVGQKNIFLANQCEAVQPRDAFAFLYEGVFISDHSSCLAHTTGRFSWTVSEKKKNQ